MNTYGYRLAGNAKSLPTDYIPSLIGVDDVNPTNADVYFERIDIILDPADVTSIERTRWVNYDSLPLPVRDPILGVKTRGVNFYLPHDELKTISAEANDADLIAMVKALGRAIA